MNRFVAGVGVGFGGETSLFALPLETSWRYADGPHLIFGKSNQVNGVRK